VDIVAWAERFIATPSVSREGNEAIAGLACELLSEAGVAARMEPYELDGVTHYTVIGDLGPKPAGDDGLLLLTHLDTVPPGDPAAWTVTGGDPWQPVHDGPRLYGLGSADAKVDLVCKAAALARTDADRLEHPVRIVGTFAEEIGLVGARELVRSGGCAGFGAALVGEPSELRGILAHKGYAVFEARIPLERVALPVGTPQCLTLEGRSAHSSSPALGCNAIEIGLTRLAEHDVRGLVALQGGTTVNVVPDRCTLVPVLGDRGEPDGEVWDPRPLVAFHRAWCERMAELTEPRDPGFDPDHSVGSLGKVTLERGIATLTFDLRPVPGVDLEQAVAPLSSVAEVELVRANPALATSEDSALVTALVAAQQTLGLGRRLGTKATCTEAGLLSAAGLDVVVLGAGLSIGNVHRPNEHTRIPELLIAADLYHNVISRMCGG